MDIEDTTLLSVGAHNKVTVFIGSNIHGRRTEEARQRRHDRQWSCPGKRRRETQTEGWHTPGRLRWNQEKQTMEETDELLGFYY